MRQTSYLNIFLDILQKHRIKPNSDLIARLACPDILPSVIEIVKIFGKTKDDSPALDMYYRLKEAPKTGTKTILKKNDNIFVNGPYVFYSHGKLFRCIDGNSSKPLLLKTTNHRELEVYKDLNLENSNCFIVKAKIVDFLPDNTLSARNELNAILMPLYSGTISEFPALSEQMLLTKGNQIRETLEYLHEKGWIHLDVRGANIFINHDGNWVLGDFNQSCSFGKKIREETDLIALYFEPQEQLNDKTATPNIDFYMLGLTLLVEATCKNSLKRDLYDNNDKLNWKKVWALTHRILLEEFKIFVHSLLLYNNKYVDVACTEMLDVTTTAGK